MAGFGQDSFYAADYDSQNQNQDIGYVQSGYGQPGQDQQFAHFQYNQGGQFGQFDYGQQPGYGDSPYGGQQPSTFNPTIMTPDPQAYGAPPGEDFEGEPPLMEELGINFDHIIQKVATCNTWGIDGSSRLPVCLNVSNNNRADTILASFLHAVQVFGLPKRVRSDKGGENVLVAEYMIEHQPTVNRPFIAGRSVHNQRIERLWREV